MTLIQDLYNDIDRFYNLNWNKYGLTNPNYTRINNTLSWNAYKSKDSYKTYEEFYRWLSNNKQYSFQLGHDDSFIQLYYETDDNKLLKSSLGFIPSPASVEEGLVYLRFDCDFSVNTDYHHTIYHIHFGHPDAEMRLCLYRFPLPSHFIEFIMQIAYQQTPPKESRQSEYIPDLEGLSCKYAHYLKLT